MIVPLFRKDRAQSQAETLFAAIADCARNPALYTDGGVADAPEGRFEALAMHVFLAVERLRSGGEETERLSRALLEIFFRNLDDGLRELGVGDMSIARKTRALAGAFYGRAKAYSEAMADNGALAEAVARNVFGARDPKKGRPLAGYMAAAKARLCEKPVDRLAEEFAMLPALAAGFLRAEVADG